MIILLHASAVKTKDGTAGLFLGASGAGKSTATETFGHYGVLADDKVFIKRTEQGLPMVSDASLRFKPGEVDFEKLEWTTLEWVFWLNQDWKEGKFGMAPLSVQRTTQALADAWFGFWWHVITPWEDKMKVFNELTVIAEKVKGFDLSFDKNVEAVDSVDDEEPRTLTMNGIPFSSLPPCEECRDFEVEFPGSLFRCQRCALEKLGKGAGA